jgi:Arc/MetJ-type ribon-helix-helix transcriptional regulator
MEIETSLPEADVKFLDAYCKHKGLSSRSEALHHAVNLLRTNWLGQEYEAASAEWRADEGLIWDSALMGFDDDDQAPHQREGST